MGHTRNIDLWVGDERQSERGGGGGRMCVYVREREMGECVCIYEREEE